MRVIAGKARSLRLKTIEGNETRPTTDRIKETLFNMIRDELCDCHFLDLFSGSGGIGIEALSRGASSCVFVERNPKAMACIRDNLAFTRLGDDATLMECDVLSALARLNGTGRRFDVVFLDPPYNQLLEKQVLEKMAEYDLLEEAGIIIVEASLETDFSYVTELGYEIYKEKLYKTNKHIFLQTINE